MNTTRVQFSDDFGVLCLSFNSEKDAFSPSIRALIGSEHGWRRGAEVFLPIPENKTLDRFFLYIQKSLADDEITLEAVGPLKASIQEIVANEELVEESIAKAHAVWEGDIESTDFRDFVKVVEKAIPGRSLTRLQLMCAYHAAKSRFTCNFSVPGAGKTTIVLAAYAYLNALPELDHVNCILVTGPTASFLAWEEEFFACFGRQPKVVRLTPDLSRAEKVDALSGVSADLRTADLYLSHFATFASYKAHFQKLLERSDRRVMWVVDEAHNIKSATGVWSAAILSTAKFAKSRIILTGTPAPNGYEDLLNLFEFILPGRNVVGFTRGNLKAMSENKISPVPLFERVKTLFTRIRKSNLELPPIKVEYNPRDMSEKHSRVYGFIEAICMPELSQQRRLALARASVVRLRQAASNPKLLLKPLRAELIDFEFEDDVDDMFFEEIKELVNVIESLRPDENCKLEALKQIVEKAVLENEKIIIWTTFLGSVDLIVGFLKNFGCKNIFEVSGRVKHSTVDDENEELTRVKSIQQFKECSGFAAIVATTQSIGESISLHHWCHRAIYFDRDFNCGLFIQSKDRIHRFGLAPDVITTYHFLSAAGTIDTDINDRLLAKESRMTGLLEGDDIPIFNETFFASSQADVDYIINSYRARLLQ